MFLKKLLRRNGLPHGDSMKPIRHYSTMGIEAQHAALYRESAAASIKINLIDGRLSVTIANRNRLAILGTRKHYKQ